MIYCPIFPVYSFHRDFLLSREYSFNSFNVSRFRDLICPLKIFSVTLIILQAESFVTKDSFLTFEIFQRIRILVNEEERTRGH